jgi:polyphosphate kinase
MKTHAKASLVIRKEEHGIVFYSHMGTGNYHPKTARFYDDLGLLSADQTLGKDLMSLFNQLSGLSSDAQFNRILVAPRDLRSKLVEKIRREKENHLNGKPSLIRWKVNSLLDPHIIEELYEAAKAGVKIEIIARGICALRMSHVEKHQNVRIRSLLGRFLEHSRIYSFHNDGNPEYYIGSADIMDRNLDRRIETLVLLKDSDHIAELDLILNKSAGDEYIHWAMDENDHWVHVTKGTDGKKLEDLQEYFLERLG